MNHDQARKLIDEYADGSLPSDLTGEVKKHLDECRECSSMAEQISSLLAGINELPEKISPPHDLWKEVFSQIHELKIVQIKSEEIREPAVEYPPDDAEENTKEENRREKARKKKLKEKKEKNKARQENRKENKVKKEKEKKGTNENKTKNLTAKQKLAAGISASAILLIVLIILVADLTGDVSWQISGQQFKINNKFSAEAVLNKDEVLETTAKPAVITIPGMGQIDLFPWSRIQKTGSIDFKLFKGGFTAGNRNAAEPISAGVLGSEIKCSGADVSYKVEITDDSAEVNAFKGRTIVTGNGLESIIVPGFTCKISERGPEIPVSLKATGKNKKALEQLSFISDQDALNTTLNESGMTDGISLWHLIKRTTGENRGEVFNKLYSLYPPVKGVNQESILRLKDEALNSWFDQIAESSVDR